MPTDGAFAAAQNLMLVEEMVATHNSGGEQREETGGLDFSGLGATMFEL
jgi:hypothetical protein